MRTVQLTLNVIGTNDIEVTAKSLITDKTHTLKLPITLEQFVRWEQKGELIQDAFPNLTPSQREFLLTGITEEEWNKHI